MYNTKYHVFALEPDHLKFYPILQSVCKEFRLANFPYLALGLCSKVLLELIVGLVGDVVGSQEEGDGVTKEPLIMEGGGAGLAHGPQQTGVTISPSQVSHAALEAGVES